MNKAIQRPKKWHENNRYRLQEEYIDAYLVMYTPQNDFEQNAYFPFNPEGLKRAIAFAQTHGCREEPRKTKAQRMYVNN